MTAVIKDWDAFEILALPLNTALPLKGVKRGRPLSAGEPVARHPESLKGDLHSPVNGMILEINEKEIIIRRDEELIGKTPAPQDLNGLSPVELAQSFKYLGVDIPEVYPGEPFIIQAFDSEPGLTCSPALFSEHKETMLAGLAALNALYPEHPQLWAVTEERLAPDGVEYEIIDAPYPYSLPALVKQQITGRRSMIEGNIFSGRDLYFLGRVWRTGLPAVRMPVTLGTADYFVPIGSRIIDLLTFANLRPEPKDSVVKGGLIRGYSVCRLHQGLSKYDAALHLVKGKKIRSRIMPCRSCGECSKACPAGLDVAKAGRFSTDKWLDGKFKAYFEGCFKCGACALVCPSRRPLLSLVRL